MKTVIFDQIKYEVVPVTTIERKNGPCLSCHMLHHCKNKTNEILRISANDICKSQREDLHKIDYIFKYKQSSRISQILSNIFSK